MRLRTGVIHAAKLDNSDRLQRVLKLLSDGKEYTTRQIVRIADVCAVNTIISELRDNNIKIKCRCITKGIYGYKLQ